MALDWLKDLGSRPDHPMTDAAEAARLLAELPRDDPEAALAEINAWLDSIATAEGFRPARRLEVIGALDEAGRLLQQSLLADYLHSEASREFRATKTWTTVHEYWARLAAAYDRCIADVRGDARVAGDLPDGLAALLARAIRAAGTDLRVTLLRYLPVPDTVWQELYAVYRLAIEHKVTETPLIAYRGERVRTSPRLELAKALMLDVAYPESMAPVHIELAYRISSRLAPAFVVSRHPDPLAPFAADLTRPRAPRRAADAQEDTPTLLHFGAGLALEKLQAMLADAAAARPEREAPFGSEFTPADEITVIRHLLAYWGNDPPHRVHARIHAEAALEVVHGYRSVCAAVTRVDYSGVADLSDELKVRFGKRDALELTEEHVELAPETWQQEDLSVGGVGTVIPPKTGGWAAIGCLCAVKTADAPHWMTGVIRRLVTDQQGRLHAGIELLAKDPLAVWLRVMGSAATGVSNWATTSGSFEIDYVEAIMLSDRRDSIRACDAAMPAGTYARGKLMELMLGEGSRQIALTELIESGKDFERVRFEWVPAAGAAA